MNNKDLLNEGFFKKKKPSYEEQMAKKYSQYTPVSSSGLTQTGLNAIDADDTKEIKKRLLGTLGVTLGNNTVKNMANRALKKFPIIVSEHVDPSTVVLLKNYLEAQYAEYLNLLISNQIIDLSDYERNSPKGNIAIQALDQITGADFGKQRLANKAMSGELGVNDLFQNVPIYQLLRQESYQTGDENVDSLLENALVVDSSNEKQLIDFIMNEATLFDTVQTASTDDFKEISKTLKDMDTNQDYYSSELRDKGQGVVVGKSDLLQKTVQANRSTQQVANDLTKRGYLYTDDHGYEHYDKLTNTEVTIDPHHLSAAVNETVGELLLKNTPSSRFLKDRFEKATWLLQSRLIAGSEYAAYVMHLGLPIRKEVYGELIKRYPAKHIIVPGKVKGVSREDVITAKEAQLISEGRRFIPKIVEGITKVRVKDVFKVNVAVSTGAGAVVTGAVAAAIAGLATATVGVGAAIGGLAAGLTTIVYNAFKNKGPHIKKTKEDYKTWQRVEELIQDMDDRTYRLKVDAIKWEIKNDETSKDYKKMAKAELEAEKYFDFGDEDQDYPRSLTNTVESFRNQMSRIYESVEGVECYFEDPIILTEEDVEYYQDLKDVLTESDNIILEKMAKISLAKPGAVTMLKYDDKKDFVVPSYGTANLTAYGSVDYDRRDLKDRKFNTPLIMTVRFKERYSDGSYADNELTAVIGILGVITRIPTEEMEYILKSNAQGTTLKGIFSGDGNSSLGDLFSAYKAKNDYSKLSMSADTWKNLEKVSHLAMANKMAGKMNNNVANAHIIFSNKEITSVRQETGLDYLRDRKASAGLMKRYSAMNLMIADDTLERVFIFNDIDSASWDVVPYDAIRGRDSSDLMASIANKFR